MAGRATSTLGGAHHTTSKAAVLGLTRHLAREWAVDGITVNAISPGIVDTPAVRAAADETRIRDVTKTIPLGRLGEPREVAALVAFLASLALARDDGDVGIVAEQRNCFLEVLRREA